MNVTAEEVWEARAARLALAIERLRKLEEAETARPIVIRDQETVCEAIIARMAATAQMEGA